VQDPLEQRLPRARSNDGGAVCFGLLFEPAPIQPTRSRPLGLRCGLAFFEVPEQLRLIVFVDDDRANLPIAWISAEAGLRGKGCRMKSRSRMIGAFDSR